MKIFLIILGAVSLGLGIVGIFLPLLPTTPFLLLAAALFCRSSPRLYGWLMCNRYLGPYISKYRQKKGLTLSTKIVSVALLWGTMGFCIFWVVDPLWLKILLGVILVGVTAHLLSFKTLKKVDIVKLSAARPGEMGVIEEIRGSNPEFIVTAAGNPALSDTYYIIKDTGNIAGYTRVQTSDDAVSVTEIAVNDKTEPGKLIPEAICHLSFVGLMKGKRALVFYAGEELADTLRDTYGFSSAADEKDSNGALCLRKDITVK